MKYFSMFSGIGGMELGIQQAYEGNNEYAPISKESEPKERSQGRFGTADKHTVQLHDRDRSAPLCVGYSEIDKYAIQIYERWFNGHTNYGDATKIDTGRLPDFDLLVGGFPCQAFSVAGKRLGFSDTRGTLFFDIARILADKRPRNFLLENVKGLLSHDEGKTFQTILGVLTDLGYWVEWQVLNSKDFGVPQNRERVFLVGHLGGEPTRKVFPIGEYGTENTGSGKPVFSTIRSTYPGNWNGDYVDTNTVYRQEEVKRQPLKFLQRNQKNIEGDYSFTVDGANTGGINVGTRIRRLTPTECERLQGFPDGWTDSVSDSQRYKCLGNAVTVNVVAAIVKKLAPKEGKDG